MSYLKPHFQDINKIRSRMTDAEKEWYRNFVLGYFGNVPSRLRQICESDEQYAEIRAEAIKISNSHKRNWEGGTQRSYDPSWIITEDRVVPSPEDAIIEALDSGTCVDAALFGEKNPPHLKTRDGSLYREGDE